MIEETLKELQKGICELTCQDEFSVEYLVIGTLSKNHMANEDDMMRAKKIVMGTEKKIMEMWDVSNETWRKIPKIQIVDIERLTGPGIGKESKTEIVFEDFLISVEEYDLINIPMAEENKLIKKDKNEEP
tara:strand:+ start:180 stop:569 length:390 start_codon:yes stop_codon:yes gene_type:complete